MLRKINSLLTIPTLILAMVHIFLTSLVLTGVVGFTPWFTYVNNSLLFIVAVHVVISVLLLFGKILGRGHRYIPQNKVHFIQMFSGILMVVFVIIHMSAYGFVAPDGTFVLRAPSLSYYITECLLILSVSVHFMVSIPRLAISLGLIKEKSGMKTAWIVSTIVSVGIFVASILAYSYYYLPAILGGIS